MTLTYIFHAGDLNSWYGKFLPDDNLAQERYSFEMEETFNPIAHEKYFLCELKGFKVGLFVPMHFVASGFDSSWRMKEFTDEKNIPFWEINKEGETIEI